MLTGTIKVGEFRVDIYSSDGSKCPLHERWLVLPQGDVLRVAIADSTVSTHLTPVPGGDEGQFAAAAVTATLGLRVPLKEAFIQANKELHTSVPGMPTLIAAAVAADISQGRDAIDCSSLIAADCELWASDAELLPIRLVIGGDARTSEAPRADTLGGGVYSDDATVQVIQGRESRLLGPPEHFHRHAIGLTSRPRFTMAQGRFFSVILATFGARLSEAPRLCATPETLLAWLEYVERASSGGDFTAMLVTRTKRRKAY
jgi:hypothetical protein